MRRASAARSAASVMVWPALAAVAFAVHAQAQGVFASGAAPTPTAAQLAHGRAAYGDNCVSCHGANLNDGEFGPALKGESFRAHWSSQSPEALLTYIQTRMPPAGPGTLSTQTYADIEAYILQANGPGGAAAAAPQAVAPPPAPARAGPPEHAVTRVTHDAVYTATLAQRQAKLAAVSPVTDAMLRAPAEADWLVWRRTWQTHGFSPLRQINKANVAQLRQAWSWSLPVGENEIAPIVHDGVMFVVSGNAVQALDAANGDLLWQYIRPLPEELGNGRAWRVKAIAVYGEKVFSPTADGHLVALDVKSGKLVWDYQVYTPEQGDRRGQAEGVALHLDGGPIAARGKVFVGVSLGIANQKGGDYIVAVDAETGREAWRFNTVDQAPPGRDSWNGWPAEQRFGGGVWSAGSYDPDLNLVYFGIGNTYDSKLLLSPRADKGPWNAGLYTDTTVALDADTGRLRWHYQHMNRDVWDLDWVFEQTLLTLTVGGQPRNLVVTGGKIAMFDAVDRATGQYVFTRDLGLQNLVKGVDPKTGEKITDPALEPEPGKAKLLCPGSSGARSWPTTAFNPATKILYVPMIEACADYTYAPRSDAETAKGGIDMRFAPRNMPDTDGRFGRVQAINLETGKVVWTDRQRFPVSSSLLATAGGLVFEGFLDRRFQAYDEATGKVLWRTRVNASPSSSPITYSVGGRQYVALVTGGGGAFDSAGRGLAPEIDSPAGGNTVVVFSLPAPEDSDRR